MLSVGAVGRIGQGRRLGRSGGGGGPVNEAPVITAPPEILGTPALGETLTADRGPVTGTPTPTPTGQWLRNGAPIIGATADTYDPQPIDQGRYVSFRQTETNSEGVAEVTSDPVLIPAFDPATLFSSGEAGAWFKPNSIGTMYQTDPGTELADAEGDPVGLIFDHSQALALGSELLTNGDFSSGSAGWSLGSGWTVPADYAEASTTVASAQLSRNYSGANGQIYRIYAEYDLLSTPSSPATIRMNIGGSGQNVIIDTQSGLTNGQSIDFLAYAGTTTASTWLFRLSTNLNYAINYRVDNISIRQLLGNHARQATAGNRPLLDQGVNGVWFIENVSSDTLNWIAPAGTYTVAYVIPDGTVTILTGQSLNGATNIMPASQIVEYIAVNRALTTGEADGLTAYLEGVANPT